MYQRWLKSTVNQTHLIDLIGGIEGINFILFALDIIGNILNLRKALQGLLVAEFDGRQVDIDSSLDPTASRFLHAAPVFEGLADQGVSGNAGDGLVPIPDLDRG